MVRVGTPSAVARPEWYDRNPTSKADGHATTAAPHTITERVAYTVPSGKKAIVEMVYLRIKRVTAATTAGTATSLLRVTPSGGSAMSIMIAELTSSQNSVGDKETLQVSPLMTLFTGDKVSGDSLDTSTGGTVEYQARWKLTEFDA